MLDLTLKKKKLSFTVGGLGNARPNDLGDILCSSQFL